MALGAMLTFVALWAIASLFALALQSNLSQPWRLVGANCSGTVSPRDPQLGQEVR